MQNDAVVVVDLEEDPTLPVPMLITPEGVLKVRGEFIESEERTY